MHVVYQMKRQARRSTFVQSNKQESFGCCVDSGPSEVSPAADELDRISDFLEIYVPVVPPKLAPGPDCLLD